MTNDNRASGPPKPDRSATALRALFWFAVAATVAPLLSTRYLPFTDLPEHVAAMATMSRWFDASGREPATYHLALGSSPYLLYHTAGAVLTWAVGSAILANRLLLVAVAIALPLSVRAALRALGRYDAIAVLACMPFLSRPLFIGFLPYVAAAPLYFLGIALVVRRAGGAADRRRTFISLGALAVALLYTHVSMLMVFVPTAIALELVVSAKHAAQPPRTLPTWLLTRARSLAWLAPATCVGTAWSIAGTMSPGSDSVANHASNMSFIRSVVALPLWTFDVFRGHIDEICGGVWWTTLALAALLGARRHAPGDEEQLGSRHDGEQPRVVRLLARMDPALVPLLCVIGIYLVMPFRVGAAVMLNVRLAPLVALTATLTLGRSRSRWYAAVLATAAAATAVHAANATLEIRAIAREHMANFDEILEAMRPGTRLVTLAFNPRRGRTHFDPYPFAGSYHRASGGLVASYSFSELPHWSVQFRSDARPPVKSAPFWIYAPCEYRHAMDGPYYDYVLVNGDVDPFAGHPAGPPFREIRRASGFVLYEKVAGEEWWTGADVSGGPCWHRH